MGYGLPAAIAASFQSLDRPVVAVVGDGGMLMMLHNLTAIVTHRLPILTVVLIDQSLSLIRFAEERRDIEPFGVDFPSPDFVVLAGGFGVSAHRVENLHDLRAAVANYLRRMRPTLLEVPVNMSEYRRIL
jgi:thiamine pyrophosphate-dependent acetolactate synthase large subunit-like protein